MQCLQSGKRFSAVLEIQLVSVIRDKDEHERNNPARWYERRGALQRTYPCSRPEHSLRRRTIARSALASTTDAGQRKTNDRQPHCRAADGGLGWLSGWEPFRAHIAPVATLWPQRRQADLGR